MYMQQIIGNSEDIYKSSIEIDTFKIIEYFNKNIHLIRSQKLDNTTVNYLSINYTSDKYILNIRNQINSFVSHKIKDHRLLQSDIVEWSEGSNMKPHKDLYESGHHYVAILYINDDYQGGETLIQFKNRPLKVFPKKGKLVCFNGMDNMHSVCPIYKSKRYTIISWFCKEI